MSAKYSVGQKVEIRLHSYKGAYKVTEVFTNHKDGPVYNIKNTSDGSVIPITRERDIALIVDAPHQLKLL